MPPFAYQFKTLIVIQSVLFLTAVPVWADTLYTAVLDGPTSETTSPAYGTATLILNSAETEVDYYIEYSGLQGNEIGGHFHNAVPGDYGPRLQLLLGGSPKSGIWQVGPFEVGELNAGRVYINIHTDLYPAGEIRGNIEFASVATEAASWGSVKALYK
jgi:hypothetical protein